MSFLKEGPADGGPFRYPQHTGYEVLRQGTPSFIPIRNVVTLLIMFSFAWLAGIGYWITQDFAPAIHNAAALVGFYLGGALVAWMLKGEE